MTNGEPYNNTPRERPRRPASSRAAWAAIGGVIALLLMVAAASAAWILTRDDVAREQDNEVDTEQPANETNGAAAATNTVTLLSDKCSPEECFIEGTRPVGYGAVEGYYIEDERERGLGGSGTTTCDTLHLTGGSEVLLEDYRGLIERGNSVNRTDEEGDILLNIHQGSLADDAWNRVLESNLDNPVRLSVLQREVKPMGVPVCYSFVEILDVGDTERQREGVGR